MIQVRLIALAAVAAAVTAGCFGTEPNVPKSVEVAETFPTGIAGLALATAPTFSVRGNGADILGGIAVTITVTAGGGTLVASPTTTLAGAPTPIGTWTLGQLAGPNIVTVTVGNLTPLVITVNGVPGPPASIAMVAGNGQAGLAGAQLPTALTAQVRDQFGNGVAGSVVAFAITSGDGTLAPATVTTDANGNAGGVVWRLGKSAIPQLATVSSAGFSTGVTAIVATDYSVDLRFFGPAPSPEATAAFTDAAARVRAAVVGDVPDVDIPALTTNGGISLSQCGVAGVALNEVVDDVIIYATVVSIDGPGKILASAGPCFVRLATGASCVPAVAQCQSFSLVGVMRFDADDITGLVSTGRLNGVVLHEMMHVVGVGTNWSSKSLLSGRGTSDPRFVGSLGIAGCTEGGGTITCSVGIPVENSGGPGTADAHWRESIFDTELMTGFAEVTGVATPLSNMTIQSLADEGYTVNAQAADPYTIPFGVGLRGLRGNIITSEDSAWDIVVQPVLGITRSGTIRKLVTQ